MVCSPFEQISSLDVLGVFCVREKVFNLNVSTFFTPKRKNPRDRVPFNKGISRRCELRVTRPLTSPLFVNCEERYGGRGGGWGCGAGHTLEG